MPCDKGGVGRMGSKHKKNKAKKTQSKQTAASEAQMASDVSRPFFFSVEHWRERWHFCATTCCTLRMARKMSGRALSGYPAGRPPVPPECEIQ